MSASGETIPIASDHAGIEMKNRLVSELTKMGYQPDDIGGKDPIRPTLPDYAHPRQESHRRSKRDTALRIGRGHGHVRESYPGVRAALAGNEIGELSREAQQLHVPCPARF